MLGSGMAAWQHRAYTCRYSVQNCGAAQWLALDGRGVTSIVFMHFVCADKPPAVLGAVDSKCRFVSPGTCAAPARSGSGVGAPPGLPGDVVGAGGAHACSQRLLRKPSRQQNRPFSKAAFRSFNPLHCHLTARTISKKHCHSSRQTPKSTTSHEVVGRGLECGKEGDGPPCEKPCPAPRSSWQLAIDTKHRRHQTCSAIDSSIASTFDPLGCCPIMLPAGETRAERHPTARRWPSS